MENQNNASSADQPQTPKPENPVPTLADRINTPEETAFLFELESEETLHAIDAEKREKIRLILQLTDELTANGTQLSEIYNGSFDAGQIDALLEKLIEISAATKGEAPPETQKDPASQQEIPEPEISPAALSEDENPAPSGDIVIEKASPLSGYVSREAVWRELAGTQESYEALVEKNGWIQYSWAQGATKYYPVEDNQGFCIEFGSPEKYVAHIVSESGGKIVAAGELDENRAFHIVTSSLMRFRGTFDVRSEIALEDIRKLYAATAVAQYIAIYDGLREGSVQFSAQQLNSILSEDSALPGGKMLYMGQEIVPTDDMKDDVLALRAALQNKIREMNPISAPQPEEPEGPRAMPAQSEPEPRAAATAEQVQPQSSSEPQRPLSQRAASSLTRAATALATAARATGSAVHNGVEGTAFRLARFMEGKPKTLTQG